MKHFTLFAAALMALCSPISAQTVRTKYLSTSSQTFNVSQLQQTEQPVQISRILMAGYNSICLPMTLNAEQLQAAAPDVRVERFTGMSQQADVLNLFFVDCTAEGIQAGVPYLIYSPKTQYLRAKTTSAEAVSTDLRDVTMTDAQGNRVVFASSWEAIQLPGRYGIPAKQDTEILESILVRTDGEQTFLPTRCGFSWETKAPGASKLQIKHVPEAGVDRLENLKQSTDIVDIYDVSGTLVRRQVQTGEAIKSLPRGIYVIGSEKVVVK
ncbi:MAG: T9SS type A sorting domain-containing protein [Bacteroidaceae bacterium]|nr:T9SS type A sorting domain-containing protein [Bacteroidaceae bacterium]